MWLDVAAPFSTKCKLIFKKKYQNVEFNYQTILCQDVDRMLQYATSAKFAVSEDKPPSQQMLHR